MIQLVLILSITINTHLSYIQFIEMDNLSLCDETGLRWVSETINKNMLADYECITLEDLQERHDVFNKTRYRRF